MKKTCHLAKRQGWKGWRGGIFFAEPQAHREACAKGSAESQRPSGPQTLNPSTPRQKDLPSPLHSHQSPPPPQNLQIPSARRRRHGVAWHLLPAAHSRGLATHPDTGSALTQGVLLLTWLCACVDCSKLQTLRPYKAVGKFGYAASG